jgi:sialic acid synthase SpsE
MSHKLPSTVMLGPVPVGECHPPVFMAEVGTFFNSNIDHAFRLLEAVAANGVKVFKTEILHTADIVLAGSGLLHTYNHAGGRTTENYRALVERKTVPLADYARLLGACRRLGLEFVCSVYDAKGADFVAEQGGCGLKIARNNVNNVPLIRHATRTGIPIIFDMGQVHIDEITAAVRVAREAGAKNVIVNLHPGTNPAPAAAHHLAMAESLRALLDCPIGLSCHHRGEVMLYAAAARGISLLEKGVDFDPDRAEQDVVSAMPVADVPACMARVQECWEAIGSLQAIPAERDLTARSGVVARRTIAAGEVLDEASLGYAWPPAGIGIEHWDLVVGRRARVAIAADTPVTWSMIDGEG